MKGNILQNVMVTSSLNQPEKRLELKKSNPNSDWTNW